MKVFRHRRDRSARPTDGGAARRGRARGAGGRRGARRPRSSCAPPARSPSPSTSSTPAAVRAAVVGPRGDPAPRDERARRIAKCGGRRWAMHNRLRTDATTQPRRRRPRTPGSGRFVKESITFVYADGGDRGSTSRRRSAELGRDRRRSRASGSRSELADEAATASCCASASSTAVPATGGPTRCCARPAGGSRGRREAGRVHDARSTRTTPPAAVVAALGGADRDLQRRRRRAARPARRASTRSRRPSAPGGCARTPTWMMRLAGGAADVGADRVAAGLEPEAPRPRPGGRRRTRAMRRGLGRRKRTEREASAMRDTVLRIGLACSACPRWSSGSGRRSRPGRSTTTSPGSAASGSRSTARTTSTSCATSVSSTSRSSS